jgi:hypothetical protein
LFQNTGAVGRKEIKALPALVFLAPFAVEQTLGFQAAE